MEFAGIITCQPWSASVHLHKRGRISYPRKMVQFVGLSIAQAATVFGCYGPPNTVRESVGNVRGQFDRSLNVIWRQGWVFRINSGAWFPLLQAAVIRLSSSCK